MTTVSVPPDDLEIPVDFTTFVLSLSSSAAFHMGLAPHPEKEGCCANLPMAKQTIDILCMLRTKTAGNLTGEEERILDDIIEELTAKYNELRASCGCV